MDKSKILGASIAIIYILFVVYLFNGQFSVAYTISSLLCPFIALMYFLSVKRKTIPFMLFLVLYSISDLLALFRQYMPDDGDYYVGNTLYILAYGSLVFEICRTVCVLKVLKNFKFHMVVLLALNIYIIYVLHAMVEPFVAFTNEFFIELVYNIIILMLLSLSLLNYFYKDTRKSLYMFIGALCIVFAEVIATAFWYLSNREMVLNFFSVTLYLVAFIFFFKQAKIRHKQIINRFASEEY